MIGGDLRILKKIDLKSFSMIAAFSGWPDAKRVATYAAQYLVEKLQAERIGEIDSAPFYDFTIQRPIVSIEQGLMKEYELPQNRIYAWKGTGKRAGLTILIGQEPHPNWPRYVESFFHIFSLGRIRRLCLLGGLIDHVPHTVEPVISGLATNLNLLREVDAQGVERTTYMGPSSVHSLIIRECARMGVSALSLWGHAPPYIKDTDIYTAYHLLLKAVPIIGLDVDLTALRREGEMLRKQLDAMMDQDQSFAESVRQLELEYRIAHRKTDYIS
ncbi:MAG: PAC2 family protein [Candidatus Bathyarchaeia archaeon]